MISRVTSATQLSAVRTVSHGRYALYRMVPDTCGHILIRIHICFQCVTVRLVQNRVRPITCTLSVLDIGGVSNLKSESRDIVHAVNKS